MNVSCVDITGYFDIDRLCALLGVRVLSYAAGAEAIAVFHLESLVSRVPGIAGTYKGERVIFFDNERSFWKIHFVIAKCLATFELCEASGRDKLTWREELRADWMAVKLLLQIGRLNPRFFRDMTRADLCRLIKGTG